MAISTDAEGSGTGVIDKLESEPVLDIGAIPNGYPAVWLKMRGGGPDVSVSDELRSQSRAEPGSAEDELIAVEGRNAESQIEGCALSQANPGADDC